jgi:hypothetical protein
VKHMVRICSVLSASLFLLFLVFAWHSISVGITKESLYAGPVGYWLGVYLAFGLVCFIICSTLIAWMAINHRKEWKSSAWRLASAVTLTLVAYVAWNAFAQSRLST